MSFLYRGKVLKLYFLASSGRSWFCSAAARPRRAALAGRSSPARGVDCLFREMCGVCLTPQPHAELAITCRTSGIRHTALASPSVAAVTAVVVHTLRRRSRRPSVRLTPLAAGHTPLPCRAQSIAGRTRSDRGARTVAVVSAPRPSSRPAVPPCPLPMLRVALHRRRCHCANDMMRWQGVVRSSPEDQRGARGGAAGARAHVAPSLCSSTRPTRRVLCVQVVAPQQAVPCLAFLRRESCSSCSPTSSPAR